MPCIMAERETEINTDRFSCVYFNLGSLHKIEGA